MCLFDLSVFVLFNPLIQFPDEWQFLPANNCDLFCKVEIPLQGKEEAEP